MNDKIISTIKSANHAFRIINGTANKNNNYSISVTPGTVNTIIPNNIITNGNLANFDIKKDTLTNVILKCTSNGQIINSAKIVVKPDQPVIQTPTAFGLPSDVEILLGVVYNENIYQCVTTNLFLGGYVQYITNSPDPNSILPYTIYLSWGENRTV